MRNYEQEAKNIRLLIDNLPDDSSQDIRAEWNRLLVISLMDGFDYTDDEDDFEEEAFYESERKFGEITALVENTRILFAEPWNYAEDQPRKMIEAATPTERMFLWMKYQLPFVDYVEPAKPEPPWIEKAILETWSTNLNKAFSGALAKPNGFFGGAE